MARRILTLLAVAGVVALLVPTFAEAQYGTTTTTAPATTTTTAGVAGITVPTIPPVTLPTVPGATSTTLVIKAADLKLSDLLSGNIAAVLQQLSAPEKSVAAQKVAQIIKEILASAGVDINEIIIVGGATIEAGEDPDTPVTFSFSTGGYAAFAVVTFIVESEPVLLGTAAADDQGQVSGTFELPADLEPGEHTVSAIGVGPDGEPVVSQQTIKVAEPEEADEEVTEEAAPAPGDDDDTNPLLFILIGVLAVVALGFVFAVARTKPATTESETK